MNHICLTPEEAKQAAELPVGGKMMLSRKLKKQPPKGYDFSFTLQTNEALFQYINEDCPEEDDNLFIKLQLQYPVGIVLAGKEIWARGYKDWGHSQHVDFDCYNYKVDAYRSRFYSAFESPAIMLREAVRSWLMVIGNRIVKRDGVYTEVLQLKKVEKDESIR